MMEIQWNPSRKDLRVFSTLLIVFCAVVAGLVWYRSGDLRWPAGIAGLGLIVGGLGAAWPAAARPVYLAWMVATFPIGWTISHIILAAIYFLVFTPIGLLLRLFGHDPLDRRSATPRDTYWHPPRREPKPTDYFQQF